MDPDTYTIIKDPAGYLTDLVPTSESDITSFDTTLNVGCAENWTSNTEPGSTTDMCLEYWNIGDDYVACVRINLWLERKF